MIISSYVPTIRGTMDFDFARKIHTKKGGYWVSIDNFRRLTTNENRKIIVEQSRVFNHPIRIIQSIDGTIRQIDVKLKRYQGQLFFILFFIIPLFTIWYKRMNIVFTFLYYFSLYITPIAIIGFIWISFT